MSRADTLTTLLRAEMAFISRSQAFRAGIFVYLVALTTWAFGWGDTTTASRARIVETVLLTLVMPWVGLRCASPERGNDLIVLSTFRGVRASRILVARGVAVALALATVVLSGVPIMILATRISAAPPADLLRDLAAQCALAIAATAAVLVARYTWPGRVQGWLAAAMLTAAVTTVLQSAASAGAAVSAAAIGGGLVMWTLANRADASLRYMPEQTR
jgi:hypothetical protein